MTKLRKFLLPGIGLLILLSFVGAAPRGAKPAQSDQTIEGLLNPDGTLKTNSGFKGSISVRGWRLTTTQRGAPRFVRDQILTPAAVPDDVKWDDRFSGPGASGDVTTIAIDGSDVYVGGVFQEAGGIPANNIAKWDGTTWSALGSGTNARVLAIAVSGSNVFAGGDFFQAGGQTVNFVAMWNGSSWSALGTGVNQAVHSLAVSGSNLYVGGLFSSASGLSAAGIARWNGSNWFNLAGGINGSINSIAIRGSEVFVAGIFSQAGVESANNVAVWNGLAWSALGAGVIGGADAVVVVGADVYLGGLFTDLAVTFKNLARWNGTTWLPVGGGVSGGFINRVKSLATDGVNVYVGGDFASAGGGSANGIAKWDGSSWSALGSGVPTSSNGNTVDAIAVSGTDVLAGGDFSIAGGLRVDSIAKWNGMEWSPLGLGLSRHRDFFDGNAVAISGADVYVGGDFDNAGGAPANNIAKWDGQDWSALGTGIGGGSFPEVFAVAVSGNEVYVGGRFATAGGAAANNIAKWDGANWSALGNGVTRGAATAFVNAIAISGNDVYVGGIFTDAGGVAVNNVARWNGAGWSALGSGVTGSLTSVNAIAINGADVFVAGSFSNAGGVLVNNIARWNGSSWFAVGPGLSGTISALAVSGSDLYAGGAFTFSSGGVPSGGIARWDGSTWNAVGGGLAGVSELVRSISVSGSDVFVTGLFSSIGGVTAANIAKWDGSSWSPLGSGLDDFGRGIAANETNVYVAGDFTTAGTKPSSNFAWWNEFTISPLSQTFPFAGGTGTVDVTGPGGSIWTATSNVSWVSITSGSSGSGNGTVAFSVASNSGGARTGTITVAGRVFRVNQASGPCSFSLSSTAQSFLAAGGSGAVGVITMPGCAWTAISNDAFITITSGPGGTGGGAVSYNVAANGGASRTGTMTIAGLTFTVSQSDSSGTCTFSLSSTSQSFGGGGGSNSVNVSTQPGCNWTAISNDAWITINSGASGSGNGSVNYSVAQNIGPPRTGTMTIAGQTFTVNQSAGTCSVSLSPGSRTFPAIGGVEAIAVNGPSSCTWTAVPDVPWITITSGGSGSGDGTILYQVGTNNTTTPRSGNIDVGGQTHSVFQEGFAELTIFTTSLPNATLGSFYNQFLGVSGGTAPYSWSFVGGALPASLTLNTSLGSISGTPQVLGDFQFTVRVTDSGNRTAQRQLVISVFGPPLSMLALPLPAAVRGASYSHRLTALGGFPPYSWSLPLGGLPQGLSFDAPTGTIAGIPSITGTFRFTVTVTDQRNTGVSTLLQLVIIDPSQAPQITNVKYKNQSKLIVIGRNFDVQARLILDGTQVTPRFVDSTRLIVKGITLSPGSHEVKVVNANGVQSSAGVLSVN